MRHAFAACRRHVAVSHLEDEMAIQIAEREAAEVLERTAGEGRH